MSNTIAEKIIRNSTYELHYKIHGFDFYITNNTLKRIITGCPHFINFDRVNRKTHIAIRFSVEYSEKYGMLSIYYTILHTCPECNGTGYNIDDMVDDYELDDEIPLDDDYCIVCNGTGDLREYIYKYIPDATDKKVLIKCIDLMQYELF